MPTIHLDVMVAKPVPFKQVKHPTIASEMVCAVVGSLPGQNVSADTVWFVQCTVYMHFSFASLMLFVYLFIYLLVFVLTIITVKLNEGASRLWF